MLSVRHITHKLRSQSLNEEPHFINKSDLDRDSGTESDDELDPASTDKMEQEMMDSSSSVRRRERTRSESGKENSVTSSPGLSSPPPHSGSGGVGAGGSSSTWRATRQRKSVDRGLRERCTEAALASAVAALSATDLDHHQRAGSADSPIEFCIMTDSALPSDSDHGGGPWGDQHSSEEELECINGPEQLMMMMAAGSPPTSSHLSSSVAAGTATAASTLRFGPSAFGPPGDKSSVYRRGKTPQQGPEKRKWAQVSPRRGFTTPNGGGTELVRIKSRPRSAVLFHQTAPTVLDSERSCSSAALDCCYSASSDDEVQALVGGNLSQDSPLPLEFRTSPPEGAHRSYPTRSLSPPPKLFLTDEDVGSSVTPLIVNNSSSNNNNNSPTGLQGSDSAGTNALAVANGSPRKRHRHTHRAHQQHHNHIQRPCLDFEKMQQMKNRSVSTWRHDGELSLFCW